MLISRAKSFLTIFLAMCLCVGLWFSWIKVQQKNSFDQRAAQAEQILDQQSQSFTDWFRNSGLYLNIAAGTSLIRNVEQDQHAAADHLMLVGQKHPEIYQLRILNTRGMEIIRIERQGDDLINLPQDQLQNKSTRYYFQHSQLLKLGEIYMSPIDLNVEQGEIEQPWLKTVRFSTPVHSPDDRLLGYLIFNLDIGKLLGNFENRPQPQIKTELLNTRGYWVSGVEPAKLFGFQINPKMSLLQIQPNLWQKLLEKPNDSFILNENYYTSRRLNLQSVLNDTVFSPNTVDSGTYILLNSVPVPTFWSILDPFALGLLILLVLFGAVMTYLLNWAVLNRQQAEIAQKETEKQYFAQERMASLGRLVAGVAHELKTPIGNVYSASSTLKDTAEDFKKAVLASEIDRNTLDNFLNSLSSGTSIIEKNIARASDLLNNFRQTANHQTNIQRQKFNLGRYLKNVSASLQQMLEKENIDLIQNFSGNLAMDSYPAAITQTVINLIENARKHAFRKDQSGRILLSAIPDPEKPLSHIQLKITDDGLGIPVDKQAMVFEPFYTTRAHEDGTGLGLSIVHNMVTNILGGSLKLKSRPGKGTTLLITLPRYISDDAKALTAEQLYATPEKPPQTLST